LGINYTEWRSC